MVMEPDPVMRGLRQQPHATVQVERAKREGIEPCHDLPVGDQGPVGLLPALTLHYPKHTGSPLSCESEDDEASGVSVSPSNSAGPMITPELTQ